MEDLCLRQLYTLYRSGGFQGLQCWRTFSIQTPPAEHKWNVLTGVVRAEDTWIHTECWNNISISVAVDKAGVM